MDIKADLKPQNNFYQTIKNEYDSFKTYLSNQLSMMKTNVSDVLNEKHHQPLSVHLPNLEEDSIELKLKNKDLIIKARFRSPDNISEVVDFEDVYDIRELGSIDVNNITAEYANSMLRINVLKTKEPMPLIEKEINVKYAKNSLKDPRYH
jgi:HSP20 family molecular chaperone IbpA